MPEVALYICAFANSLKFRDRLMPDRLTLAAIAVLGAVLSTSAVANSDQSKIGPHDLLNVSGALLQAYNAKDAPAFRELLAPSLQDRYSHEDVVLLLARCRALTHDIERLSLPSWGGRHYGFYGVYGETLVLDMVLEIDEAGKIVHWVITDDVTAQEQQCAATRE